MSPTEGEKQAEWRGGMKQEMHDIRGDVADLKEEQRVQGDRQVAQGEAIAKLNTKMLVIGTLGPLGVTLIIGLIILLAQNGAPTP